ncbi:MAG: hypothetical protein HYX83_03095 [Chloroflexi bacterium]|nr:hypothetical protein [Chloroflexota bacterium]
MPRFNKLVCIGRAGFVGSEVIKQFKSMSDSIVAIDNFRTGFRDREELSYVEVPSLSIDKVFEAQL